jgi:hypothetical protein
MIGWKLSEVIGIGIVNTRAIKRKEHAWIKLYLAGINKWKMQVTRIEDNCYTIVTSNPDQWENYYILDGNKKTIRKNRWLHRPNKK